MNGESYRPFSGIEGDPCERDSGRRGACSKRCGRGSPCRHEAGRGGQSSRCERSSSSRLIVARVFACVWTFGRRTSFSPVSPLFPHSCSCPFPDPGTGGLAGRVSWPQQAMQQQHVTEKMSAEEEEPATSSASSSALVTVPASAALLRHELYFLMIRCLDAGPCHAAAAALRREVNEQGLMPERMDWKGKRHRRTLEDMERVHPHIGSDHLWQVCAMLPDMLDAVSPPAVPGVRSLLGNGRQSLLRSHCPPASHSLPLVQRCLAVRGVSLQKVDSPNLIHFIAGREQSGRSNVSALTTRLYRGQKMHRRYIGHLAQIFCVTFDRTDEYILTGADDSLVKIWSANDGRLLATLRGHSGHITDFSVNFENTLLATASEDKQIRIWNLKTTAPIAILSGHAAQITSVIFCPLILKDDKRYLVSTGNDGCVCFWKWNVITSEFDSKPHKFIERPKAGCHILASSFSRGGTFLAVGSTDHYVRVYHVDAPLEPAKILEIEAHSDQVDSLLFSNRSLRLVSGSKDGTANIWFFERQVWKNIRLSMSEQLPHEPKIDEAELKKIRVNMVAWNCDDTFVLTSASDNSLRVWESKTGKLVHSLREHKDDAFVVEAHPFDPRLVLTGGHDGYIIVWDIIRGTVVNKYHNLIEGQGIGAIYDAKWSRNGQMITTSDSHGHMAIIGFGDKKRYERVPEQVFFHTDYRPLVRDGNGFVIDEQTQCPPHQMPPPFLVDIDGNPHPTHFQRLVPGRENSNDDQLVPYISVNNERGVNEILQPVNREEAAPPVQENPTIDDMIQLLDNERRNQVGVQQGNHIRRDHDYVGENGNNNNNSNNNNNNNRNNDPASNAVVAVDHRRNSNAENNVARRRDGDAVEGVRQPGANWQSRDGTLATFWMHRTVVRPLSRPELRQVYSHINDLAKLERDFYKQERRKRPPSTPLQVKENYDPKEKLTRRRQRINQQRSGVALDENMIARARNLTIRRTTGIIDYENGEELLSDSSNEHRFSGAESWSESTSLSESESEEDDSDEEANWDTTPSPKKSRRSRRQQSEYYSEPDSPKEPKKSWQLRCREFLDYLFRLRESVPFRSAVDPIQYPDYYTVVDTPMDLGTVREQLMAGVYDNMREFRKDIDLIFANSKSYNTDKRSKIYAMTLSMANLCKGLLDDLSRQHKRPAPPKKSKSASTRKPAKPPKKKRKKGTGKKKFVSSSDLSEPGPSGLCTSAASEEAGPSSSGMLAKKRTASQRLTNGSEKHGNDTDDDTDEDYPIIAEESHRESDETEIEDNVNTGNDTDATEIAENDSSQDSFGSRSSVEPPSKRKKAPARSRVTKRLKKESHSEATEDDDVSFSTRTPSRSSNVTATSVASTSLSEGYDSGRRKVPYVGKGKYPAKLTSRTRNGGVSRVSYAYRDDDSDASDFDYDGSQRNGTRVSSRGRLIKFKGQSRNAGQVY